VPEWLNGHAWKVCVRDERTAGSNPALSASTASQQGMLFFKFL